MDDATKAEIEVIRERVEAATPGPLGARIGSGNNVCTALASENESTFDEFVCDVLPDYALESAQVGRRAYPPRWEANRNLIEHAYSDIPRLLAIIEEQEREIERLRQLDDTRKSQHSRADWYHLGDECSGHYDGESGKDCPAIERYGVMGGGRHG